MGRLREQERQPDPRASESLPGPARRAARSLCAPPDLTGAQAPWSDSGSGLEQAVQESSAPRAGLISIWGIKRLFLVRRFI